MSDLVSIVVPAYNVEKFIGNCINSIQKQGYSNWEAIVVNDGSTDNTIQVVERLIKDDKRFHVINQENKGVSVARNVGIEAAAGKYITFLDGDDMWESDFLFDLINAIETNNVDMAYCGYCHLYSGGLKRRFSYSYFSGSIFDKVVNGSTIIHIGAVVINKELMDQLELRFTPGCLVGQDQEFIWKLVSQAKVQTVPKELMLYRIRSGSAITAKWDCKKHIHAFYGFLRAANYIMEVKPAGFDERLRQMMFARVAYKLYKLVWRMIKNGYSNEARELMKSDEYQRVVVHLDKDRLSSIDKIKYRVVTANRGFWWQVARLF